jgi:hypothetical protein
MGLEGDMDGEPRREVQSGDEVWQQALRGIEGLWIRIRSATEAFDRDGEVGEIISEARAGLEGFSQKVRGHGKGIEDVRRGLAGAGQEVSSCIDDVLRGQVDLMRGINDLRSAMQEHSSNSSIAGYLDYGVCGGIKKYEVELRRLKDAAGGMRDEATSADEWKKECGTTIGVIEGWLRDLPEYLSVEKRGMIYGKCIENEDLIQKRMEDICEDFQEQVESARTKWCEELVRVQDEMEDLVEQVPGMREREQLSREFSAMVDSMESMDQTFDRMLRGDGGEGGEDGLWTILEGMSEGRGFHSFSWVRDRVTEGLGAFERACSSVATRDDFGMPCERLKRRIRSLGDPGWDLKCGIGLVVVAAVQLVGRELGTRSGG